MSLLDDETLKEVGRVTIEFNTLDELITVLAAAIFECTEWSTAEYLRKHFTGPKLEQIKGVCNILADAHGIRTTSHRALLDQIELSEAILKERNTIIHGELTIENGKRPRVHLKKSTVELSPQTLSELVQKINRATDGLLTTYYDFMDAVYKARDAKK